MIYAQLSTYSLAGVSTLRRALITIRMRYISHHSAHEHGRSDCPDVKSLMALRFSRSLPRVCRWRRRNALARAKAPSAGRTRAGGGFQAAGSGSHAAGTGGGGGFQAAGTGQAWPVAAWMSAGRGMPDWVPGLVTAAAPAAVAATTASAGVIPAARATARAPTNVSPAPTVSTARTRNPGTVAAPSGPR